jgi:hypothetical protein
MAFGIEEKRRFPRVQMRLPLRYQIRGTPEYNNTLTDDVGLGGLGFVNTRFIAPQTQVALEFSLLSRLLRPNGKIAWVSPIPHSDRYKLGIKFTEVDPKEQEYISDFIDMQMGML